jgi:hypothetical protein
MRASVPAERWPASGAPATAGTIAVDAVGVGLAAFGLLNPLLAAFIHVGSELAFILNSARLLPARATRSVAGDSPIAELA